MPEAAGARVTIPLMLAQLVRGERRFDVPGSTVREVLEGVCHRHPELRVHLFDESGELRPNVSCFVQDRRVSDLAAPVASDDRVTILQAVSGG